MLTAALLTIPQHLILRVALSLPTTVGNNRTGTVEDGGMRAEELRLFCIWFSFKKKKICCRKKPVLKSKNSLIWSNIYSRHGQAAPRTQSNLQSSLSLLTPFKTLIASTQQGNFGFLSPQPSVHLQICSETSLISPSRAQQCTQDS